MHYLGADIIEIPRIKQAVEGWGEVFLHRVYTDSELSQCRSKVPSLAARFAGKEAVYKALGGSGKGIGWKDIEILADSAGKPLVRLHGPALTCARNLGINHWDITLSHSREYALALVVGEAK